MMKKNQFLQVSGPDQQLENITFEEVLKLFEMPKNLGDYQGEEITVNNGRFGPYLKHKGIFISIPRSLHPTRLT